MAKKSKQETAAGDQQVLARVLKEALKSGKYTIGAKEVVSDIKTSKMVVLASTASNNGSESRVAREAEKARVAVVKIDKSSAQLGRMLGRPFRVSAVALRTVAEGDYRALLGSPSQPKASE